MFLKLEPSFPIHPADIGVTGPGDIEFSLMGFVQNSTQVFGQFLLGGLDDQFVIVMELTNKPLKRVFRESFVLLVLKNPLNLLCMLPEIAAA
jgi:hypothetical protein